MDHILCQILKITETIKHKTVNNNPPIIIYVNKIENRITFRIKTGYYLQHLKSETLKLLGNTKSKKTKDENGEKIPHLEITEVVLAHYNIVTHDYQQDSRVLHTYVPNRSFGQLLNISRKTFYF